MQRAERFSGRLGAWLSLVGVAVGLGNVWRFPYMMGAHGGSAFLLLYVGLTLFFAIPMLSAELALGRETRAGILDTYRAALGARFGAAVALVLVLSLLVADSYYMVVIGNILYTTVFGARHGFSGAALARYHDGLSAGHVQYLYAAVVLLSGIYVLSRGVNRGIERASRWFVPAFGVLVLYLVGYTLNLPGAGTRVVAFLEPDFGAIGVRDVFAALGQACFSLGLGGTFMVVYATFLPDEANLPRTAVATALGDLLAALFAALFLVPTILYFGLDMGGGPGLLFDTLPKLFSVMPAGRILGSLFLAALCLMAFLSAVAGLEVCASGFSDLTRGRLGRTGALGLVAVLELCLMWPSAHDPSLIGPLDLVFGSGMQILGALLAVTALAWGLGGDVVFRQIFSGRRAHFERGALFWLRWVVPVILCGILGLYVWASRVG